MTTQSTFDYRDQDHLAQASRIGKLFDLPDAAHKITRDGLRMEHIGTDTVVLTVTLTQVIDRAEAEAIINATPLEEDADDVQYVFECAHWEPGRITYRGGCTACAAEGRLPMRRP